MLNKLRKILIKKATIDNLNDVFLLSNDENIRKNSFNTEKIIFEDHYNWFLNKLKDENFILLLCFDNEEAIGQVKYQITNDTALIGIGVKTGYYGMGIAKRMFEESLTLLKENKAIKYIVAQIKKNNLNSIHFFEKNNFIFSKEIMICDSSTYEYKYTINRGTNGNN